VAFRQESVAVGEGPQEDDNLPDLFNIDSMLSYFVFISLGSLVTRITDPRLAWTFSEFENLTAASTYRSGAKGRPTSVAKIWLRHPERVTVDDRTFRAGGPRITQSPSDHKAINTWREPPRIKPPADWKKRSQPFLDHVAFLVPDNAEREFLLDWLAHIEQRPGVLPHVHVLMVANRQGIGRNWLSGVLARVWPGVVGLDIDLPQLLDGGFNGRLSRKILAVVNEIREGSGAAAYRNADRLKSLLTDETRRINPKYGREFDEFNAVRWLMFSNHENALPLDRFDRRIYAISNPDTPRAAAYYRHLYALAADAAFIASVREVLRLRDIKNFNPGMLAPMTTTKRKVIEAGMSEADLRMQEIVATFPADVITTEALCLRLWGGNASAHDFAALRHIAARAGAVRHARYLWFPKLRKQTNVWALRNPELWLKADGATLEREYRRGIDEEAQRLAQGGEV
jgi:hypothetical protein